MFADTRLHVEDRSRRIEFDGEGGDQNEGRGHRQADQCAEDVHAALDQALPPRNYRFPLARQCPREVDGADDVAQS